MDRWRHEHWQLSGNWRVNFMAVDDGYVQLFGADRIPMWMNAFDLSALNLAGGFSYLVFPSASSPSSAADVVCTCFSLDLQRGAHQHQRTFLPVSFSTQMSLPIAPSSSFSSPSSSSSSSITISHRIFAPFGDDPLLLDEVSLVVPPNTAPFSHWEYWDVALQQLTLQWARSGPAGPIGDLERTRLNREFSQTIYWSPTLRALIAETHATALPANFSGPEQSSHVDYLPPFLFLAPIDDEAAPCDGFFGDQDLFFFGEARPSDENITQAASFPRSLLENSPGQSTGFPLFSANASAAQAGMFGLRSQITRSANLTFAYGYLPTRNLSDLSILLTKYRKDARSFYPYTQHAWSRRTLQFTSPNPLPFTFHQIQPNQSFNSNSNFNFNATIQILQRELQWRSIQLLSNSLYHDFYRRHWLPQGSEYLYLSGADGAPRDQCLFAIPALYLSSPLDDRLSLPRQTLEMVFMLRPLPPRLPLPKSLDPWYGLWYAIAGFGQVSGADDLHRFPSDIDIFLLLSAGEYLSLTAGDPTWLQHSAIPFTSPQSGALVGPATALYHLKIAFYHLKNQVGTGPHGLIRILQGDWDDGVVVGADPDPKAVFYSVLFGESIPNTQMAIHALRVVAPFLSPFDAALSSEMLEWAGSLASALEVCQNASSRWFPRAWMRDADNQPYLLGNDFGNASRTSFISLQAQVWGLILAGPPPSGEEIAISPALLASITAAIQDQLMTPIGPIQAPSLQQVWPAISQLYTWGLARRNQSALAWSNLLAHAYQRHNDAFPEQWIGTLSGPDGWDAGKHGGTWISPVTPMIDFPVSNLNPDAMFLLGTIRLFGWEPTYTGAFLLDVARPSLEQYRLSSSVIGLDVDLVGKSVKGRYQPPAIDLPDQSVQTFCVVLPNLATNIECIPACTFNTTKCPMKDAVTISLRITLPISKSNLTFSIQWE